MPPKFIGPVASPSRFFVRSLGFALPLLLAGSLSAQVTTLTWDPLLNGTGSNGDGTWDNSTANWANGGSDIAYLNNAPLTLSGTAVNGSSTVTFASTAGLSVGQVLSSSLFPNNSVTITAISSPTEITVSQAASGNGTGNMIFGTTTAVVFPAGGTAGTTTVTGDKYARSIVLNAPASGSYLIQPSASETLYFSPDKGTNGGAAILLQGGNAEFRTNLSNQTTTTNSNLTLQNNGTGTLTVNGASIYGTDGPKFVNNSTGTIAFNNVAFGAPNNGKWMQLSKGNFTFSGANTYTVGGGVQVGQDGGVTTATIESGGSLTVGSTGNVNIGRNGASVASLTVNGALTLGGDIYVGETGSSQGTLNVAGTVAMAGGKYLYINKNNATNGSSGIVNITNGSLTTTGVVFGSGNATSGTNSAQLNITGGSLVLTSGNGIHTGNYSSVNENNPTHTASNTQINLGGGTIVANAAWSSAMNMTLTGTNGNITFQAESNAVTPVANNVTLSGVLSGSGGLNKTGAGSLTLSGANTYTGDTVVSAGTFNLAAGGELVFEIGLSGFNNSVTGAGTAAFNGMFVFDLLDPNATSGTWIIADVDAQSFGGTFSVEGWTSIGDTYTFNNYVFDTNTGVLTAVPEPSTYALTGVLMLGLAALRARRRKS